MNKALILTALLGVAALAGVLYTTQNSSFLRVADYKYANDFKKYTQHFGKAYGHDEGFYRYTFYAQNKDIIAAQNTLYDQGKSTYFLGENDLTDMNLAEYKAKLLGYKRSSPKQAQVATTINTSAVPASVDWTTKGAVNPVKNQGQCGSCWAFSATSALESLNFLKNGKLVALSEQSVVDCSQSYGNQGCNGGLMDQAFQYVAAQGIPTSASYPYTGTDGTCSSFTSVFKNVAYTDVTVNSDSALVAAIAQQPVSVAIEADTSAFQLYAGGILNDNSCGTTLDHGVTAVGYGSGFFKIRNSWGASWGESGYVRLARTGDGAGMCGVQQDASYPTA